jgi:HD-GYP domain-containing protein (c-di-GMP phosphodiesterase class II)
MSVMVERGFAMEDPLIVNPRKFFRMDKKLVMVFFMVAITWLINFLGVNQYALLSFFFLPVLFGSYFFGKTHGTFSAVLAVLMVYSLAHYVPGSFATFGESVFFDRWASLLIWGGVLVVTGYTTGLLYDKKEDTITELDTTYRGVITMLSIVIDSVDRYTHSHSYRVSVYSEKMGNAMGLPKGVVEELRIAALLHDLGKIGVSEHVLNKAGRLEEGERREMAGHPDAGARILAPVGPRVLRILPLILHHHERYDGKGYNAMLGRTVPVGARIIAVADVYDALTTDRPYRRALTPEEGLAEISRGSGTHFDPEVVEAFVKVFNEFIVKGPDLTSPMERLYMA